MSRKPKFTKAVKVKACKDYNLGKGSFNSIAESVGVASSNLRNWYLAYKIHGESAFDYSNINNSYTSEFKNHLIELYTTGKYSFEDLGAINNISHKIIRRWYKNRYNGIELKDYDPKGDVYTMESRKTTLEERLTIVKWVIENDMNYKLAADKYAVKYALVYQWVKKYNKDGEDGLKHKRRGPKAKATIDENLLSEMEKLKLELDKEKAIRKRLEFSLEVHKKKEEFARKLRTRK